MWPPGVGGPAQLICNNPALYHQRNALHALKYAVAVSKVQEMMTAILLQVVVLLWFVVEDGLYWRCFVYHYVDANYLIISFQTNQ